MHKSRIVLSFDDGRKDNIRVIEDILRPAELPATINIATGYVLRNIEDKEMPCPNEAMISKDIKSLYADKLFEIGGHGRIHENTMEDWLDGLSDLSKLLGSDWIQNGVGIASPHCGIPEEEIKARLTELKINKVKYVRIGLDNQFRLSQRLVSRLALLSGSKMMFLAPIKSSFRIFGDKMCIYSVPVLNQHSFDQLRTAVEWAEKKHLDCIFMLHSILKPGEMYYDDMFSWDYDKFKQLCNYLTEQREKGKIEVVKTIDLFSEVS